MRKFVFRALATAATVAMLTAAPIIATATERSYQQVVDGVVVYFGMLPAELVRGHPREHTESRMHGGVPVGESHLTVALFDDKTGSRVTNAELTARITDGRGLDIRKKLEPMLIAGNQTHGNYFQLTGAGPYRIEIMIRRPGAAGEIRAIFTLARS